MYTEALGIDQLNKKINTMLLYNRAISNLKLDKVIHAIKDCNNALSMDSRNLKALLLRAKCYGDLRMFEKAASDYEVALTIKDVIEIQTAYNDARNAYERSTQDWHFTLGVVEEATNYEIKKAYRKLALIHHPDRHCDESQDVMRDHEKVFKRLNTAFMELSNANIN